MHADAPMPPGHKPHYPVALSHTHKHKQKLSGAVLCSGNCTYYDTNMHSSSGARPLIQ